MKKVLLQWPINIFIGLLLTGVQTRIGEVLPKVQLDQFLNY